jgi:MoaA/NifB/PqqE/SkfB family radical SAM enzyme
MQKHLNANLEAYEQRFPARFPGFSPLPEGFRNGVRGYHVRGAPEPGLRTLEIEHVPDAIASAHNDPKNDDSALSLYFPRLCLHRCASCFSKEISVYGKGQRMLTMQETFGVVDQAMAIASAEGHAFESVRFLGPGELLMNPQLFEILDEYRKRGIRFSIFTKGALLGHDGLARKFQKNAGIRCARELVERLASYGNVGLLLSFQSFDARVAQNLVSTKSGQTILGLRNYPRMRDDALESIISSDFFRPDGTTERVCAINAPIVPENIGESFDIYRFMIERGIPVMMTPTMVSGLGSCQLERQKGVSGFIGKVVELYSGIYLYNIKKGIQSLGQIVSEGISSYVGAEPCNMPAHGLYVRANGDVQMCTGRRDAETLFGNVSAEPLSLIWGRSPHLGMDPVNNRCPAKDSKCPEQDSCRTFPFGFYDAVMGRLMEKLGCGNAT